MWVEVMKAGEVLECITVVLRSVNEPWKPTLGRSFKMHIPRPYS